MQTEKNHREAFLRGSGGGEAPEAWHIRVPRSGRPCESLVATAPVSIIFLTIPSAAGIKADERQTNGDLSSLDTPGSRQHSREGNLAFMMDNTPWDFHPILLIPLLCSLRVKHGCVWFTGERLCRRSNPAQIISGESTHVNPGQSACQAVGVYQIQAAEIEIGQPHSSQGQHCRARLCTL